MIQPDGMTWQDWASSVIQAVADAWAFGVPPGEDRWQDFAVGLVRAPTFAQRLLPDPYDFSDWRDWARRAYPMLEVTG